MMTLVRGAPLLVAAFAVLFSVSGCASPGIERPDSDVPDPVEPWEPDEPDPLEPPAQDEVRFYHFEVGQADATLVWGPETTILVDAGDWTESDVLPYLEGLGVSELDLLVLTHPHADHIGQAPEVINTLDVTEVWMTAWEHTSKTYERTLDAALASDAGYREPELGLTQTVGDVIVDVINPGGSLSDIHDCLAVRIQYEDFAAVYTGDAETEHEANMIADNVDLSAQLLQLGHHGSSTSSSPAFLDAVDPEVAIYSAEPDSQYGHPHAEVVQRVEDRGVPLYGTPESGTILVTTNGTGYVVSEQVGIVQAGAQAASVSAPAAADEPDELAADDPAMDEPAADDCIDINRAAPSELEAIAHLGPARAAQVAKLRPFSSLAELERVDGLGEARVRDIIEAGRACVK